MPGMNGYELAIKLNENRKDKVPVIFLTASHFDEKEVVRGYTSGAVDYLYKPIDSIMLFSKVNVFLDLFNQKNIISRSSKQIKIYSEELLKVNYALKKSELKYKSYINNAPDAVFVFNNAGRFIEINNSVSDISGFSNDEFLKMQIKDLIPPETLEDVLEYFNKLKKEGSLKTDLFFLNKNGLKIWIAIDAVKLSENRYLGFAKEITQRKKAEDELKSSLDQLHKLSQHIEKIREEERVAISRELHDDLGQSLTAVKIDLGIIKESIADKQVVNRINDVAKLVSATIKTVQKITSQLRPEIIDNLGLEAAIEWYTQEYSKRNNIEIHLDINAGILIPPDDSLIVFRIMQESLTNISRHAKASKIEIKLSKNGDYIELSISDNGIGITESEIKSKKSFGIIGMMERAASLGGNFNIYNKNGYGTVTKLLFPIKNK
jgi:PAS domain S-box-containing protein